ncbi:VanZ family protein [Halorarum salinum]|uniref:VanZ family protein n=1 Tax=Halorarum salinum TaxID=2743089 RepID=A0A7D5Q8W7_9EURY|nr:VanZ family protein [Halobaculum salinum]QLG61376.1 VanZ family protein [Halobaculum salinum]
MNGSNQRWATFAAVVTGVALASLVPVPGDGRERLLVGVGLDKWAHAVGYAAVSLTFARARGAGVARREAGAGTAGRIVLAAIVVGFAIGAGVELLQAPLATRTASIADVAANAVGAAAGSLLWRLRNR